MSRIGSVCLTLALSALTTSSAAARQPVVPKNAKAISLTGCLTSAPDNGHELTVMTTTKTAPVATLTTVYRLIAIPPAAEVKKHEKHRVTVTGWLTGPPPKGDAARAQSPGASKPSAVMDVRVKDILHIADSCK